VVLDDAEEKQITNQSFLGTCLVKGLSIRYYFYIYSSL
jgi:small nuclear ribonucleoprotein (snRNP)-like protein